jgi:DNA-binding HxlR family transcriptional regulator
MRTQENGGAPLPREALDGQTIPGRPCPVAASLALIGEKWSLLALREVSYGNHRFTDIARNTGAPRDRLAARLKALVEAGVLEQRQYSDSPPRHDYHLTPAGRALRPVLRALVTWGNDWAVDEPRVELRHGDHTYVPVTSCATCGEQVEQGDIHAHILAPDWTAEGPVPHH